jgi:signal transduction histidine kinase
MMQERPKILIVDDREENLIALEVLLQDVEADCVRALTGNQALQLSLEQEFALAIIDVQMPEMDGYETVKLMRNVKETKILPVIFVSAIYSENYYLVKGIDTGAVDFISKPFIPEMLMGKVRVFLELYKHRHAIEQELVRRKRTEAILRTYQNHLKLINTILRHDLTNNLAVIKSSIRLYSEEKDTQLLDEAEKSIQRSLSLIKRMRNLEQQIEQDDNLKVLNLTSILNEIASHYKALHLHMDSDVLVFGHDMLYSVFENIITNAITHGRATEITLTCLYRGTTTEIVIQDNGTGIPEEIRETLFEKGVTAKPAHHSGQGLFIAREAVEEMGGSIELCKTTEAGSCFVLQLIGAHA